MSKRIKQKAADIYLLTCILIFIMSTVYNHSIFYSLLNQSVVWYQLKQVLALLGLFWLGKLVVVVSTDYIDIKWKYLLALPTGICIWSLLSFLFLMLEIPYTICIMFVSVMAIVLVGGTFLKRREKISCLWHRKYDVITLGCFMLASTGFVFIFLSYDSYYYFINYGKTLTIVDGFAEIAGDNSFTLTNIGQFLPLLNSYTAFWGIDQSYFIQAALLANLILIFAYGFYCLIGGEGKRNDARRLSILFSVLLSTSMSFIIIGGWVLANMYCMVYITILIILPEVIKDKREIIFVNILYFAALALLRKDGLVFVAFLVVCFSAGRRFTKKELTAMVLPGIVLQFWWILYVRLVIEADVIQAVGTSITNNTNIFFLVAVVILMLGFVWGCQPIYELLIEKRAKWNIFEFLLSGILIFLFVIFCINPVKTVDFVDVVIKNMFRFPSSWGWTAYFFIGLFMVSLCAGLRIQYLDFVWIGYSIFNFISYAIAKGGGWVNWDDSYNRVLMQIIPIMVMAIGIRIVQLLRNDCSISKNELKSLENTEFSGQK